MIRICWQFVNTSPSFVTFYWFVHAGEYLEAWRHCPWHVLAFRWCYHKKLGRLLNASLRLDCMFLAGKVLLARSPRHKFRLQDGRQFFHTRSCGVSHSFFQYRIRCWAVVAAWFHGSRVMFTAANTGEESALVDVCNWPVRHRVHPLLVSLWGNQFVSSTPNDSTVLYTYNLLDPFHDTSSTIFSIAWAS